MDFSKRRRSVSLLAKMRKETGQVVGRSGSIQTKVSVIMTILAAQNAGAARRANGILRVSARESGAACCQPVQVGSDGLRVTFVTRASGLVLVGDDVHHVQTPGTGRGFVRRPQRTTDGEGRRSRADSTPL